MSFLSFPDTEDPDMDSEEKLRHRALCKQAQRAAPYAGKVPTVEAIEQAGPTNNTALDFPRLLVPAFITLISWGTKRWCTQLRMDTEMRRPLLHRL